MTHNLLRSAQTEGHLYRSLKQRLSTDFPDIDEQTLEDTLEGATNLTEVLEALIASALDDQSLGDALDRFAPAGNPPRFNQERTCSRTSMLGGPKNRVNFNR